MAYVVSLGRVNCGASPTQITSAAIVCNKIFVAPIQGMTANLVFGLSNVNKTTLAGVIKQFVPTVVGAGVQDFFVLETGSDGNALKLSDYWLDGTNGEGFIISYLVV